MKRKDYKPGDKVSRRDAYLDILWDFSEGRFFARDEGRNLVVQFFHTLQGQFVNLTRLAGVADRDLSQDIGKIAHILFWVALLTFTRY